MSYETIKDEWLYTCQSIGGSENTAIKWFDHLFKEYNRDGRYYHDLSHIMQMLDIAHQHAFEDWNSIFFAIWFHDSIQNSGKDNELKSAELSRYTLQELGADTIFCEKVYQLIMATQGHQSPRDKDTALFIDCDLSILGSTPEIYQRYSIGCRKEYNIPDFMYSIGRRKFLKNLLKRPYIFQTNTFQKLFEKQARTNIKNELQNL